MDFRTGTILMNVDEAALGDLLLISFSRQRPPEWGIRVDRTWSEGDGLAGVFLFNHHGHPAHQSPIVMAANQITNECLTFGPNWRLVVDPNTAQRGVPDIGLSLLRTSDGGFLFCYPDHGADPIWINLKDFKAHARGPERQLIQFTQFSLEFSTGDPVSPWEVACSHPPGE